MVGNAKQLSLHCNTSLSSFFHHKVENVPLLQILPATDCGYRDDLSFISIE